MIAANFSKVIGFPQKTGNHNQDLYTNNLFYLRLLTIFRSMFFIVAVWVSMELRYIGFSQIALIDMIIVFSGLFLELPTGALADLIGRKISITMAFVILAISYVIFAFANSFTLFLIAGLGFGLGDALISGALEALVFDTLKQNNKEHEFTAVNNSNQLIFNYSIVFAIIVGGLLYQYNYYLPSLLTGLAFVCAAFVAWLLIEPDIDSEKFTLRNYLLQTKMGFKELFKNQKARDMSLFYILVGSLTWPIVLSFKNYALVDLGVNERNIGFTLAILSLVAVQFLHLLIRKKVFEKTSNILLAPSILLMLVLPLSIIYKVESMIPLIFAIFFSSSLRWNILGRLTNQCYSSKNRATAISSLSMLISAAYIATLILFVALNQITDNAVQLVLISMGIIAIVLLPVIAWRLKNRYQEAAND